MNKSIRWITLVILLLSMSAIACGLVGGGGDEPVATVEIAVDDGNTNEDNSSQANNNDDGNNEDTDSVEATAVPEPTDEPAAEPTDAPAVEPTDEPAPKPTNAPTGDAPALDISSATNMLENVNSYRMEMNMSFEGVSEGEDVSGSMEGLILSLIHI